MATPVQTDKWAGNLECTGECRRKRLMAQEFSKSALERYRRNGGGALRCKQCVQKMEQAERDAAQQTSQATSDESRICASCKTRLNQTEFNKNQWNKGEGVSRCRACVEKAVANEGKAAESAKDTKLKEAKEALETAKKSGNAATILKAESIVAALEAEKVTGLKPQKMSRGSGRGGRRGGRGRGSASNRSSKR